MPTELLQEIKTEACGAAPVQPVPILLTVRELNLGGIERDVTQIALTIDRSRFSPHVASYTGEGMRFEELRRAGVPLLHLPITSLKSPSALSAALKMRKYLREHHIQLVHAYDSSVVFVAPVARALRVPAVLSSTLGHRDLHDPRTRREVRWTDRIVDTLVVNCEAMRRHMVDDEGMARERIELCYNGVNTTEFYPGVTPKSVPPGASLVMGAVCALRPEKAIDLLQEAFARVRSLKPGMKLVIVGSGSEQAKLEANSRRLGIQQDCLFVPATRSVAQFLRSFDIYVSCSQSEAFSNTILEAMACGRAVVGSRVGGTPELIGDDERGVLFEPGDAVDLAEKLAWLIENKTRREDLGTRAAEFASQKLSIEVAARRMAEIYEGALHRRARLQLFGCKQAHPIRSDSDLRRRRERMNEHLVIMFAYHYPPENAIGGNRPFRFAKYLTRLGYTCRVFTAAEQAGRRDPDVEHVPDPFFARSRRSFAWQLERAFRKFVLPGELGSQWAYHSCRAAQAFLRKRHGVPVTVFSTFPPLGAHLAAWQLARAEHLPWIADFRDPFPDWSGHPEVHTHHRAVYRRLERTILRRADAVIANTDGARSVWLEKFPSCDEKIHVIWNGFDPEERVGPIPIPPRKHRVLCHLGHLYKERNAAPVLESLARLVVAGRLSADRLRVRLIGTAEPGALPGPEFLARAQNQGWLDMRTQWIERDEALNIERSSDGLLLLQPQSSTQVPGKLFEYLQIGRPILAFVQPNSPSERLLERSGVAYRCVYPGSTPSEIDEAVAGFFEIPSAPVTPSAWFENQFNAEKQTRALDSLIHLVHGTLPSPERVAVIPYSG